MSGVPGSGLEGPLPSPASPLFWCSFAPRDPHEREGWMRELPLRARDRRAWSSAPPAWWPGLGWGGPSVPVFSSPAIPLPRLAHRRGWWRPKDWDGPPDPSLEEEGEIENLNQGVGARIRNEVGSAARQGCTPCHSHSRRWPGGRRQGSPDASWNRPPGL